MRLLLAEDTRLVREPLVYALERAGWAIDAVADGGRALERAVSISYDAIVLDIMLPNMDGITVLTKIRRGGSEVPVILLTACGSVRDRIRGLDAGADDYLPKPFHVEELLARLRTVTRRHGAPDPSCAVEAFGVSYDPERHALSAGVASVTLTQTEGLVLETLLRRAGRTVTRTHIEEAVWGACPGSAGRLEAQVSALRAKLAGMKAPVRIRSVRGVGYVLEGAHNA